MKNVLVLGLSFICFVKNYAGIKPSGLENTKCRNTFTENKGQVYDQSNKPRPDVLFSGTENGMVYHIRNNGISYQLSQVISWKKADDQTHIMKFRQRNVKMAEKVSIYRVDINWIGINADYKIETDKSLPDYMNYYNQICPNGILYVKSYTGVTFKSIYNGIDLHYYEKNATLKYDYLVSSGADYKKIQLEIKGAEKIMLLKDGSIVLNTPLGKINEGAPIVFQGGKQLKAKWVIKNNTLSFDIENYSSQLPLVIDPVTRLWGTYYGGISEDSGWSCSTDNSGNIYLGGYTESAVGNVIATVGAYQTTYAGNGDVFLAKLNAAGVRQWATYYGGSGTEFFNPCNADGFGNVYISGNTTSSAAIASPGAHQTTPGGGNDAFLAKFNSNGIRQWGTYYGASGYDVGSSYCTDNAGNVYLVGYSTSGSAISTPGAFQVLPGGGFDCYLAKFNSAGVRQWGTYLGGMGTDEGGLACTDASGNVYVTGITSTATGTIIATPGTQQPNYGGGTFDAFLVKFNSSGIRQWGTYYGDASADYGYATGIDVSGNVYLSGTTSSTNNIATPGSHQSSYGGGLYDAFVVQFDNTGLRQWGTYYGGTGDDLGISSALDGTGNLYFAGYTSSNTGTVISTPGSHQSIFGGGAYDGFLMKFNNAGIRQWGTYYGGAAEDRAESCAIDNSGGIYLAGFTKSSTGTVIATPSSQQPVFGGDTLGDGFLASFADNCNLNVSILSSPSVACTNNTLALYAVGAVNFTWSNNSNNNPIIITPTSNITFSVIGAIGNCTNTGQATITMSLNSSPTISANSGTICAGQAFTINPSGAASYFYSGGGSVVSPASTSVYTITGTDAIGCQDITTSTVFINPAPNLSASGGSICTGNSFTISPSGANTYTFSGGSAIVSPTATSSYTVTGTGLNGCSNNTGIIVTVTVNPLPVVTVNSGSICSGQSFTMVPSGANTYTFSGGSAIVSPTASASYSVFGTSNAGCVNLIPAICNLTVNQIPFITVNSGSVCVGHSFTLVPSGANTYSVLGGGGMVVTPTVNTTYTITGTSIFGCSNFTGAVSSVTVNPIPTITVNSGSICAGQSFTMNPSGANSYTFQGGSSVVSPTSSTSYTVAGTSSLGCTSSSVASNINVSPMPSITVNSGSICAGQSYTMIPGGANTYTISGGTAVVFPITSTSYTVTGTSIAGCTNSLGAICNLTVNPIPVINVTSSDSTICSGESCTLAASGAGSYTWSSGGNGSHEIVSPTQTTTYTITGISLNGCTNSTVLTENVVDCTNLIEHGNALNTIQIIPNPSSGNFVIKFNADADVQIINGVGQRIYEGKIQSGNNIFKLYEIASGMYFVTVKSADSFSNYKLIIQ